MTKNDDKIGLMPKASREKHSVNDTTEQNIIIDSFKKMIDSGEMQEFIIVGLDADRQVVIASYCSGLHEGVGILEMGKLAFIGQQTSGE